MRNNLQRQKKKIIKKNKLKKQPPPYAQDHCAIANTPTHVPDINGRMGVDVLEVGSLALPLRGSNISCACTNTATKQT
jgi:hypothetical protein